ncbi:MAG: hypothetical protein COV01_03210 [Candidatus Taylorbacteria bacterium CG10_big_fil_rev_8_21_14_0_10_41_48]|uniref:Uncharacterized protein n=1 Tax=Candidatus Taylorbacteria bacterium CG10_big_fil_rev_8_21_14_0_10_41_48 TaxID=1975024 RepID=A0A2M8LBZ3_9BACT|nr:MAG: hypothetical protein COV01_03210 [Candidatus Taylorbacteria bacterium CG10_big_fil_rev_8_21_14_0_10_41_48]
MKRLLFYIAIGVSFFYLPWYVTAVLIFLFALRTGFFAEAFIWSFLVDIFYGSTVSLWGISYVFSIGILIAMPFIAFIRRRVSW